MKSWIRWGQKLGLASGIALATLLANGMQVLALTTEQVMERLRTVPVFTLANSEGATLLAVPTEGEDRNPIASVFLNGTDAQNFLNELRTRDPQAAEGIQVVPVPLAKIYEFEVSQQERAEGEQLRFTFIPEQQQIDAARTVLQQNGQSGQFQGVPLFVARSGGEEGGYLTLQQGEEQVIPMYFDRNELQVLLDRLREVQPDLASGVQIQVVDLLGVIQTLQTSDNQELNRIILVPTQESLNFVRSLQQQQGGQPAQGQPQPARPQP
jgi:Tic22-like family